MANNACLWHSMDARFQHFENLGEIHPYVLKLVGVVFAFFNVGEENSLGSTRVSFVFQRSCSSVVAMGKLANHNHKKMPPSGGWHFHQRVACDFLVL